MLDSIIPSDDRSVAASSPDPLVSFQRVSKFYPTRQGRRWILRDTSFSLPKGRSVGILGRNGAGKSTLLRMVCGMEHPSSGKVYRHVPTSWPLGFAAGMQPILTGAQNASFVARIYGVPVIDMVEFVRDFSELGPALDVPVRTYSSGMRARLNFAMSMAVQFRVYLIDELTAVGDARFRKKCEDAFAARRAQADVLIVSHQARTVRAFADSVAVLDGGILTFFPDIDEGFAYYESIL